MTAFGVATLAFLVTAAAAFGPRPYRPTHAPATRSNIAELASATPDLSTLVAALKAGDLVKTLAAPGRFTVFAPSNEAFAKLPPLYLKLLLDPANIKTLQQVLTYHVVSGTVAFAKNLKNGEKITTVELEDVTVGISRSGFRGTVVKINDATVTTADVLASNGVVHIIDTVLMPPNMLMSIPEVAEGNAHLSTLVAALKAGDLVGTLSSPGPFTVFAPSNAAFAKLPPLYLQLLLKPANVKELQKLLTYHVVSGTAAFAKDLKNGEKITTVEGMDVTVGISRTGVKINDATVTTADVAASNGVVHVIDTVLMPSDMPSPPSPSPPSPSPPSPGSPNHLYFSVVKYAGQTYATCGQVDAASRMPPALFEPQNAQHLQEYIQVTLKNFFQLSPGMLIQKSCSELGYTNYKGPNKYNTIWAPQNLMGPVCSSKCSCTYKAKPPLGPGDCKDVPDDPAAGRFCSLCGPKYNAGMPVELYMKAV